MNYVCFVLGLAILAMAVCFAHKNRSDASKWIFCIMIGIFFSTFFMTLPTEWIKEGKEPSHPMLYTLLSSLFYSFKTLGGRQELLQLETMPLTGPVKSIYICINYLTFVAAPILTSSLLLSFFGDMGGRIQYFLHISPKSKCYVFSEINENSLALAKGVKNSADHKTIVFCSTKKTDKDLLARAKALGAILLYKSCRDVRITWRFSKYEFNLISSNEDNNIELAEAMIAKNNKGGKQGISINAFVESGANAKFLESIEKPRNVELRCIDEIALFCNNLIYEHPLYDTKQRGKHISVAIIGCGRTGMRMLKTVYWAGQIDGYTLKIRVYDKNADKVREKFHQQCPGLKEESTIQFVKADVETLAFQEKLLEKDNSLDATYIVVATGDDRANFFLADELYRFYRRSNSFDEEKMPEIFARVRSNSKAQSYFNNISFLTERHVHLFGAAESIFSEKTLFNTDLENLALAVHLVYWDKLHAPKDSAEYVKVRHSFKTEEYARRSSMAAALHIPSKLLMYVENAKNITDIFSDEAEGIIDKYKKNISNPKETERMAKNEHERWNAFFLSEGYQPASKEEMLQYSKTTQEHKDTLSMLHPCITGWESLDDLAKTFRQAHGIDKNFKKYDEDIVKSIPEIIQTAKSMKGEN